MINACLCLCLQSKYDIPSINFLLYFKSLTWTNWQFDSSFVFWFFYELHAELFLHIQLLGQLPKAAQRRYKCLYHCWLVSWTVAEIWYTAFCTPDRMNWRRLPVLQSCASDVNVVDQAKNSTQGHFCQHLKKNLETSEENLEKSEDNSRNIWR